MKAVSHWHFFFSFSKIASSIYHARNYIAASMQICNFKSINFYESSSNSRTIIIIIIIIMLIDKKIKSRDSFDVFYYLGNPSYQGSFHAFHDLLLLALRV